MTQLSEAPARTRAQIGERTLRKDPWWNRGRVVASLLTIWVLYATVRVFMGHWYWVPQYHYLTPFYSPCVSGECVPGSSTLGQWIPAVPPIIPYAFVSLVFVLGFRLSCYYYRGAYYRAFWRAPAACAVREPHATVHWRVPVPADRAEPAPLLLLPGDPDRDPAHLRRRAGVPRAGRRLRHRARLDHHADQRGGDLGVHVLVPLVPAHHRRAAQALLQAPGQVLDLDADLEAEQASHGLRVDLAGYADAHRPLHHAGRPAAPSAIPASSTSRNGRDELWLPQNQPTSSVTPTTS